MKRSLRVRAIFVCTVGSVLSLCVLDRTARAHDEPDTLVPGKIAVIKPGKLVKFVSKPLNGVFPTPSDSNDPTIEGGTLHIFDTSLGGAGDQTFNLPASGWFGLGKPPGSLGFKYRNAAPNSPCKVVIVKPKLIKALCNGGAISLSPPFAGNVGIVITIGTDSKMYCASFGGTTKANSSKELKRKDAPPPPTCPVPGGVPTATAIAAATATRTAAATNTAVVNTATVTPIATNTPPSAPTATNTTGPVPATATSTIAAPTMTNTPAVAATATRTATGAAATPTNTAAVAVTATATRTNTVAVAATATNTPAAGATSTRTNTPAIGATSTRTDTPAAGATSTRTNTPAAGATSTRTNTPAAATPTHTVAVPPATNTAGAATATATPLAPTATFTRTPTGTPVATCPLPAGRYTVTQTSGGTLKVDGGAPFVFPTGGSIIEEVSAASQPDCIHNVVVPFPGGLTTPVFCSVEAFTFTTKVTQTGCGRGYIDSNGGSDFTVTELGDTNAPNAPCNFPAAACMTGLNTNVRVDLTLGGNGPDVCGGGGTANAFVGIPVHTVTWQDLDGGCPDLDGNFDAGTDTLVTDFDQNLDFTTDTSTADWTDLDPNGCCINGSGPGATAPCNTAPAGLTSTGVCMNIGAGTVTTSATGTIGSNGAPLFDLTFSNQLPSTITGPVAPTGATCPGFIIPPASGGTITRCIP